MYTPFNPLPKPSDLLSYRLWQNVAIQPSGCWEWQGKCLTEKGYGLFMYHRQVMRTHRVAYLLYYGNDPLEKFVCHKCDNPKCANPFHLFLGTPRDNMDDKVSKNRHKFGTNFSGSKLTPDTVRQIREIWRLRSMSQEKIAKTFGVHRGTILQVIHGRTWRHVL